MIRSLNILTAFLVIIGLNIISYQFFTRFDFTEGQIYTLSDSSKEIARSLPVDLSVKVFLSENLPSQVAKVRQDLKDYLDEYVALSEGKLKITYTDPAKKEESAQLAMHFGIPPLQLQVLKKDQRQTIKAYMGLAVFKEKEEEEIEEEIDPTDPLAKYEKHETIPILTQLNNFEYDFTSALKKVSSVEEKTVGFLTGHKEHQLLPKYMRMNPFVEIEQRMDYNLQEVLKKNYNVKSVSLTEEENTLEDIDTLVIAGPQEALADKESAAIKEFVKNGGNAVFLIDQIDIGKGMITSKIKDNFSNLLDHWGISVDVSLIKDSSHTYSSFSKGFFSFTLPYPFWLKVKHLNKENSITSQLESFVLPWVSPLSIEEREDVIIDTLAYTSERYALAKAEVEVPETEEGGLEIKNEKSPSAEATEDRLEMQEDEELSLDAEDKKEIKEVKTVLQERPINLDPQQNFGIARSGKDPLPLAVIAQKKGDAGKVFVMGDSDFIKQDFMMQYSENLIFFLNIVDAFTLGDELISIRSRSVTDRPISELTQSQRNFIRWGNIILLPLLVVIFGLLRKALRNARKKTL